MDEIVRDEVAFECEESGYHFRAWYLTEPKADALVEITKDDEVVKSFLWPAYKIWNIAAHASDIAEDLDRGLRIAGSDGLGGGVVPRPASLDSKSERLREAREALAEAFGALPIEGSQDHNYAWARVSDAIEAVDRALSTESERPTTGDE